MGLYQTLDVTLMLATLHIIKVGVWGLVGLFVVIVVCFGDKLIGPDDDHRHY